MFPLAPMRKAVAFLNTIGAQSASVEMSMAALASSITSHQDNLLVRKLPFDLTISNQRRIAVPIKKVVSSLSHFTIMLA